MPQLSLVFNVEEIPHNGSCFHLIAKESFYSGFCIPIQSIATAFHRILYKLYKVALVSVIFKESNSLLVTFFNMPSKKAKQFCESAISILHSEITFTIEESEFRYDRYMLKAAYEALITRALEELGWWLLIDSGSITLFNQKGIVISNFNVTSNPSLQHASQFFKKTTDDDKITINISGKTKYQQLPIFKITNKLLQKTYKEKGFVDLDYIPCKVLPKFTNAFATRIINASNIDTLLTKQLNSSSWNNESKSIDPNTADNDPIFPSLKEIQELKDYWLYSHGIYLNQISAILKVTFSKNGKALTYPIECVTDQTSFSNFDMRTNKIHFEDNLKKYISTTIGVVTLNQKTKH